jgi:4a-hydroxytetrahydrobiopterin dehydratase
VKSLPLLEAEAMRRAQADLPRWRLDASGHALERTYDFADFKAAFAFMTLAATHAERLGHHPEWENVYGRVRVRLTTHDASGLTQLDVSLALAMDVSAELVDPTIR